MILTESEFHQYLFEFIQKDMREKDISPAELNKIEYPLKRTQFYELKGMATGEPYGQTLNTAYLLKTAKEFGLDVTIKYNVE